MIGSSETVCIALGANLDHPIDQVRLGFDALAALPLTRLIRRSSLYRTTPVGVEDQPDFINAVAQIETALSASSLLAALLSIEERFGRRRGTVVSPRRLDLDLLLFGSARIADENLVVPHPRMHLRAFVLAPLLEIAPDVTIPGRGRATAWWPAVRHQRVERLP